MADEQLSGKTVLDSPEASFSDVSDCVNEDDVYPEEDLLPSGLLMQVDSDDDEPVIDHTVDDNSIVVNIVQAAESRHQDCDKLLPAENENETIKLPATCANSDTLFDKSEELICQRSDDNSSKVDLQDGYESRNLENERQTATTEHKPCDSGSKCIVSPSRHSNVFELAFLHCNEGKGLLYNTADTEEPTTSSRTSSVKRHLFESAAFSSRGADRQSELSTAIASDIQSMTVYENSSDRRRSKYDDRLNDDVKLWCRTYVKLVDCANLLLLTIPTDLKDADVDTKSPKSVKLEPAPYFDVSLPCKLEMPAPTINAEVESGSLSCSGDRGSCFDDSDSRGDLGPKKGRRRSRKKAEQTRTPKTQTVSRRRKIIASQKVSTSGAQDEVICTIDTWKKLHKSKAKQQTSTNTVVSELVFGTIVKQEPVDDFDDVVYHNQKTVSSCATETLPVRVKSEIQNDANIFNSLMSGSHTQVLGPSQPKLEIADKEFVFIKNEPVDDFSIYGQPPGATVSDQKSHTMLLPYDITLPSIETETGTSETDVAFSETGYKLAQVQQDKEWQPVVVLERFPLWILQKSQNLGTRLDFNAIRLPTSAEEESYQGLHSVEQLAEDSSDSVYLNGYSLRPDDLNAGFGVDAIESETWREMKDTPMSAGSSRSNAKRGRSNSAKRTTSAGPRTRKRRKLNNDDKDVLPAVNIGIDSENTQGVAVDFDVQPKLNRPGRPRGRTKKAKSISLPEPTESIVNETVDMVEKNLEEEKNETTSDVSTSAVHGESISKAASVEKRRRKAENIFKETEERCLTEKLDSDEVVEKLPSVEHSEKKSKTARKAARKGEKVSKDKTAEKEVSVPDESKTKAKVGFVIPKKKPEEPKNVKSGVVKQTAVQKPNSLTMGLPRIPKINKSLSEEDKQRSVLAKLEKFPEKSGFGWGPKGSNSKVPQKPCADGTVDHWGSSSQGKPDDKWQAMGNNRFRFQNVQQVPPNCLVRPLCNTPMQDPRGNPGRPWHQIPVGTVQPMVCHMPPVNFAGPRPPQFAPGMGYDANAINNAWFDPNKPYGYEYNDCSGMMRPDVCDKPGFAMMQQACSWVDEQQPIPTIGCSIPVIQHSDWGKNVPVHSAAASGISMIGGSNKGSEPVPRDVPYVDDPYETFSGSGSYDGNFDNDNNAGKEQSVVSSEVSLPSTSATSQSLPLLGEPPSSDSMDESLRLFVEAVQEAFEQGNVSPSKCDKLSHLYEVLRHDLGVENATVGRNREAASLICDTINRSMRKDSNKVDVVQKCSSAVASFSAASKFQDFDQRLWCGDNSAKYEQDSAHGKRDLALIASGRSEQRSFSSDQRTSSADADDLTSRTIALLEDEESWRYLLSETQDLSISEDNLELVRRLLLEAAKRGVCDDNLTSLMNEVCEHIKLESESDRPRSRKSSEGQRASQERLYNEDVKIPFLTEEHQFMDSWSSAVHRQNNTKPHTVSPQVPLTVRPGSAVECEPLEFMAESSASVHNKTETPASPKENDLMPRISDEMQLLEMLIKIQCELTSVDYCEDFPASTTKQDESNKPDCGAVTQVPLPNAGNDQDVGTPGGSGLPSALTGEPSEVVAPKTSSDMCDALSAASDSTCPPTTSDCGNETQDSCSSKVTVKEKETAIQKKPKDPKELEDKVISLARNALKPHYHNGAITSDEFKLIMKKAIAKICNSRCPDISQKRVAKFINAYVEKIIQTRSK